MEEENSKYLAELVAEKAKLDPSLSHCSLLLAQGMFYGHSLLKAWCFCGGKFRQKREKLLQQRFLRNFPPQKI